MGWIETRCQCRTKDEREACRCPATAKSYRAGYRAGADKIQETFDNKAQATRWLRTQEGQLAAGRHVDPRGGRMLFADWAAEWELTRTGKPSALAASKGRLDNHLIPAFGSLPLDGITPLRIRKWAVSLADELAPKTVRHCHGLLHTILDDAIDNRLLTANPCAGTQLPEAVRDDPVFLSTAELQRLIEAVPEHWQALVVLLAGTGLRWGEAVGLRARWLDLPHGKLSVRWTWSDGYGWQPAPKTKHSRRTVTLSASVIEALTPLWGQATGESPVFTAPQGGPVRHSMFTRREKRGKDREVFGPWWRAVRAAGLEEKHPTPHDLRHTHASLLIAANVPLTAIQRRLGHKTIATTSDLYGHLAEPTNVGLLAAVEGALVPTLSPQATTPNPS